MPAAHEHHSANRCPRTDVPAGLLHPSKGKGTGKQAKGRQWYQQSLIAKWCRLYAALGKAHNCLSVLICGFGARVSHDNPRTPNVHIRGSPSSKTSPKFNEKTPRERKRAQMEAGEGKTRAKFWAVRRRGPAQGGPASGGPEGPNQHQPHQHQHQQNTNNQQHKNGLAQVGQTTNH